MTAPGAAVPATPPGPTSRGDVVVLGDGTTVRSRAASRWDLLRWPLVALALLLLVAVTAAVLRPAASTTPLAPDNPEDDGARALAQVLAREGVDIRYVRTTGEAVAAARDGGTLLVAGTALLSQEQVDALAEHGADRLVLVEPTRAALDALTGGAVEPGAWSRSEVRPADCDLPAAVAAGEVRTAADLRATGPAATICFPTGDPGTGALAVVDGPVEVVALSDLDVLRNDTITAHGHAALGLHVLGAHRSLVWYVPAPFDTGVVATGPRAGQVLPGWSVNVALVVALVVVAAALWRGRRLGPVVTEPLPVIVRAAETTTGRARLYRRTRARAHAAAGLRAGAASRTAGRLGVPRTAGAPEVVDALARATGRHPHEITDLLYGPPPTDDDGLVQLAGRLDELESEVHRT